jgi:cyclopropane-fatty-acyl-phospholipid synthase
MRKRDALQIARNRPEGEKLGAAQINKCKLIAAKLGLKGVKLLDLVGGWNGLSSISTK